MRKSIKPKGNFELASWFFMRVSGTLIIVLVGIHLAYVHFVFGVDKINFKFVAGRWATPTWRTFDFVLLTLALLHGTNGARILIDDYIHARGWRTVMLSALYTITFLLLVIGGIVMLTFKA